MSAEPTTPAAPKRLTLSAIVEMLLTRSTSSRSSVALTRNSTTGETQIDVTVGTNDDDVTSVEDAERKAVEVFERLRRQYPLHAGHDNTAVSLTRNAKGETQIDIEGKTTAAGYVELPALAKAVQEEYDRLRMEYPMQSGYTAKPGSVA